jgi:hypothetical protein
VDHLSHLLPKAARVCYIDHAPEDRRVCALKGFLSYKTTPLP